MSKRSELHEADVSGRGYTLALRLSQIFNPLLACLVCFGIAALYGKQDTTVGMLWSAVALLLMIVPAMSLYIRRMRQGVYTDADVSVRQDRNELYLVGTVSVLIAVGVLQTAGAPQSIRALVMSMLLLGIICGTVNLFWKISMHGAAIAAMAMVVSIYVPALAPIVWGIALAVGWARVKTRNHTPMQVLAGLSAAAIVVAATLTLLP